MSVWASCVLFILLAAAPADAHQLTRIYMRSGAFNRAYDHVNQAVDEASSKESAIRLTAIAREIDMTPGPMLSHEREHLLRLALEGIHTVLEVTRFEPSSELEQTAEMLEPLLLEFDDYESSQLRRVSMDLGTRMLDSAEWRSALQRQGHELVEDQEDDRGLTDGDTTEEILSLISALGRTGDSRMITLIDRIRRGSRRREVVEAARTAIEQLNTEE